MRKLFVSLLFCQVFTSHWTLSHLATWPLSHCPEAYAQATNGTITVTQEAMASGGGRVGGGNPMSAVTVLGTPVGGGTANGTFTIVVGAQSTATLPAGTKLIAVEGTINDPTASIAVNGIQATITGTTFRAAGIQIVEGTNTVTVIATDPAGNRASQSITVSLNTQPPARPTVAATPTVTTTTAYTLTGTKTPGTSILINGNVAVPLSDATSWSATVNLIEGDNTLAIVARDAAGNQSATNTLTIVVDNLPPVLTVTVPSKTNFNPLAISGTVDDSLTAVTVNGTPASRSGRTFEVSASLIEGSNILTITATSPNGYVSTKTVAVILGTIPTILSLQPADGSKLYAGTGVTISAAATDKENDPLEYQFLLAGQVVAGWGAGASLPWTPTEAQRGLRLIEVRVRDGFGGNASKQAEVFVLRKPVSPP